MSKGIGDMYGFCARVAFAHRFILSGNRPTRKFETCFEMWDGHLVAAALYRKAQKNPRLMAAIPDYLAMTELERSAEKYSTLPDWKLREQSFDTVETERRKSLEKVQAMDDRDGTDNQHYIATAKAEFLNRPKTMKSWTA